MAVIKCKMCGGSLSYEIGSSVCECEYCGTKQTIPDTDDEKRLKLYERANKLRINNEFDKAAGVYESIVAEFQSEAEAYWGLVLCKYGIEYVDDPKTGKKIPTCHRSSFDAVFDDSNFDLVMENADTVARSVYREEAKQIEEIRKGIIEVSSKEEPYDIFICYKETADDGQRTIDSVIAQDVYDELTEKGYRVFFSRISLEDKLGQEYEPYIFAALNSAKVMLVFGTQYDYLNAVWVKNEWSRFLQLMESGQKKTLIPCYKNIDAYDMPKEFAKLQAQDMGKVGAIQDLTRGIDKIFDRDSKTTVIKQPTEILSGNIAYCERGFIFLEDKNWEKAKDYFNRELDINPKEAQAYLGLFLVGVNCSTLNEYYDNRINNIDKVQEEELFACEPQNERIQRIVEENCVPGYLDGPQIESKFSYKLQYTSKVSGMEQKREWKIKNKTWEKVERFADSKLQEDIDYQKRRYVEAVEKKIRDEKDKDEKEIKRISEGYEAYLEYKENEIKKLKDEVLKQKDDYYEMLCERVSISDDIRELTNVGVELSKLQGYRESSEMHVKCSEKISRLQAKRRADEEFREEEDKKRRAIIKSKAIKVSIIIISVLSTSIIVGIIINKSKNKTIEDSSSSTEVNSVNNETASVVSSTEGKSESTEEVTISKNDGDELIQIAEDKVKAYWDNDNLINLGHAISACVEVKKQGADSGETLEAFLADLDKRVNELADSGDYTNAEKIYQYIKNYDDELDKRADESIVGLRIRKAEDQEKTGDYLASIDTLITIIDYESTSYNVMEKLYSISDGLMESGRYKEAVEAYDKMKTVLRKKEMKDELEYATEKSYEARYKYCEAHLGTYDKDSRVYANLLVNVNYPGAESLRQKVFATPE